MRLKPFTSKRQFTPGPSQVEVVVRELTPTAKRSRSNRFVTSRSITLYEALPDEVLRVVMSALKMASCYVEGGS